MWDLSIAFYFNVAIGGAVFPFREVSGLSSEMETETIREGGVNDLEHRLPVRVKHGNLVMKRALTPVSSDDVKWIRQWIENDFSVFPDTKDIVVSLLDADGNARSSWTCTRAYPVKWEIGTLGAERNEVLIESLEFVCQKLKREQ